MKHVYGKMLISEVDFGLRACGLGAPPLLIAAGFTAAAPAPAALAAPAP